MAEEQLDNPFAVGPVTSGPLRCVPSAALRLIERVSGLSAVSRIYPNCVRGADSVERFVDQALEQFGVRFSVNAADIARIPRSGPLIVVANHPFGAVEGMILGRILRSVRQDTRIVANELLGRIPPLRELFILVDAYGGEGATEANHLPLRRCMRWLKAGGVLGMFPAGDVCRLRWRGLRIAEGPWTEMVARLARSTGCRVLPVFFSGRNSLAFHTLGLIHPRVRTLLLPRELINKRGRTIDVRVGSVISLKRLEHLPTDAQITAHLRHRTLMLRLRGVHRPAEPGDTDASRRAQERVADPVSPELLAVEIAQLPRSCVMVEQDDLSVIAAESKQIPHAVREIGRLRELTFRATGEGTGRALDLDRFDEHYLQLFLWSRATRQIVGAYRMGPTDRILDAHGAAGLYTSTLFKFRRGLLPRLTPGLELGRSFVAPEHQKAYQSLLLLWKGIFRYITLNPRYNVIFGAVSISNDYLSVSKRLMVDFLRLHHAMENSGSLVQPRNPFKGRRVRGFNARVARALLQDSDEVSEIVSDIEPDQKGLPVLIRQYLKLGAKLLEFNVDPHFSDCVDALLMADLTQTDPRLLDRYMGPSARQAFLDYHKSKPAHA